MCGIVGYIGKQSAKPILIEGLKRLEYRGYDSAGLAVINSSGKIFEAKAVGKVVELENKINGQEISGNVGIAHTRWATHGKPSDSNSHPHSDCQKEIYLAHNGIIENYKELKDKLIKKGHKFTSETDSEVIAHLIEEFNKNASRRMDFKNSVIESLKLLKGTYGLAIISRHEPDKIIAARMGSPLIIGLGHDENIIASDVSAVVRHTDRVIYLEDGEVAVVEPQHYEVINIKKKKIDKKVTKLDWSIEKAEKSGFPHFMLKEIFEQPESISNSIRGRYILEEGRAKLGGLESVIDRIKEVEKIIITACGTARLAGLVGEYMIEEYAGVPVEVDYSHEFRYRKPIIDKKTALIAISQSGETADTLAAVREAKEKGALALGIVNVVGSTIARETDAGVYNHSGPEISVASTKAFTSQLSIMALVTVMLGRQRQMSLVTGERIIKELNLIPSKIKKILNQNKEIRKIAKKYIKAKNFALMGRKYNHPIAFEGAIKIKELSYVHAEGFASGEMKHGPIAMIDENFPSIFVVPQDSVYEKNLSGMQEIKARGGKIIAIATEGDKAIKKIADDVIYIPKTLEMLTPLLSVVPLQLFAYHFADLNGRDIDRPRNLAKSVTVE
jgi:glutamine---fructose-6-phosphate transaminase (isomerizing)